MLRTSDGTSERPRLAIPHERENQPSCPHEAATTRRASRSWTPRLDRRSADGLRARGRLADPLVRDHGKSPDGIADSKRRAAPAAGRQPHRARLWWLAGRAMELTRRYHNVFYAYRGQA